VALSIVILAAGQGTRMLSQRPKVLHELAGRPLLEHVYAAASALAPARVIVVYGHGGDLVRQRCSQISACWVEQPEQLGTGHAVQQALPYIPERDLVLVLCGDVPLITPETLEHLIAAAAESGFALLTLTLSNPIGYGRILRDGQRKVMAIVEERDATPEQRMIEEINTGLMAVSARLLGGWLSRVGTDNAQGEYYLTDIVTHAVAAGHSISTVSPLTHTEVLGVNDRAQLAQLESELRARQARCLMLQGLTLLDPARFDLRGELTFGSDCVVDVNVILEGVVRLGNRVRIGANTVIRDCELGDEVVVLPNCVIEDASIGRGSRVGPFARLRPESKLHQDVRIGNFVEIKKSEIESGTKINHLSYVGDTQVGKNVNVGAGTIVCNYDGANKHPTVIGDGVFVGSDTQLVAPVTVGEGATIGAGTTVTQDIPPGVLALSRTRQITIPSWRRPQKKKPCP
jgi:bifunctional UDP-N-acetylglucosamine pyrophosphorylase/glucosamine-1-phosphate N-acetyltransferase